MNLAGKVRATLATILTAAALAVSAVVPAAAIDGRVPDGRAADPHAEVTAYYWHGLNRDPDAGGLANYTWFTDRDCRWGVLSAGVNILDSGEAHAAWRNDAQTLSGMLYASLLNRAPDPGGLATYTAAIRDRGLRWAISFMQASEEFHRRLDAICRGRASSNATLWNSSQAVSQALTIYSAAGDEVKACGVGILLNTFAPTKIRTLAEAPKILKATKFAAGQALKVAGGACLAAYRLLSAADRTAELASYEGDNNAVLIERDSRTYWSGTGKWCETWIRVGRSAIQWDGYKANFRCW